MCECACMFYCALFNNTDRYSDSIARPVDLPLADPVQLRVLVYLRIHYKATRSTYIQRRPWHRRCARTLTQLLAVFYETNASMSLLELSLAPEGSTFRTRTCLFVTGNASNVQYQWICNLEMKVCVVSQLIRVFSTTVSFPNLYFPCNRGFC